MKKWNAAEIEELNIAETANGFFWWCTESCLTQDVVHGNNDEENGNNKGDNTTPDTLS